LTLPYYTPAHRTSKDISAFTQQEHDTYLYWVKKNPCIL